MLQNVLVAGAGKSGIGACELLLSFDRNVILYDSNAQVDRDAILARFPGKKPELCLGELDETTASRVDSCVISPGIPLDVPFVEVLKKAGIPILSEVELAYRLGKGRLCAITGTNGKTTTTALTGAMLSLEFPETYVVGNIGIPYTEKVPEMTDAAVTVAEISSFQLETIDTFHPQVSAILNITPDHLNRHKTMENYIAVKESITRNQTGEDLCVLNYEDEELRRFGESLKGKCRVLYFSSRRELPEGLFLRGDRILLALNGKEEDVLGTGELQIVGAHNHENAMAAIGIALGMGVSLDHIREAARNFKAVEHRIEYVLESNGVVYYNDSKGTNPDAAIKGIEAMSRPTYLIAGGYDKGSDYEEWLSACRGRIRELVLLGATADAIEACANRLQVGPVKRVSDLKEAVDYCHANAKEGEAVLLSPACASWDMFQSYEQRGKLFKEYVRNAADKKYNVPTA